MKNLLRIENLLIILFLFVAVIILEGLVFSKQLNYGFRDVDWQVLYFFKLFGNLSLDHLLQEIKVLGVYIPESYYVGFLVKLIGLNFIKLHQLTHILKIISAISVYLLVFKIFRRKILAFISSIIYTFSYTHAGALFQLASGGYFLAIISMNLFLITYYFSLIKRNYIKWSSISSFLLVLTLILKPERMYPLLPLIVFLEIFQIFLSKIKKEQIVISIKRLFFILLPLIVLYPIYYPAFTEGVPKGFDLGNFSKGASVKFNSILNGNWQLLLYPFASFGSTFLYGNFWKLLGELNFQSYPNFIFSLLFGPILKLGLISFIILLILNRKPFKLTSLIIVLLFIFSSIIYLINLNWQHLNALNKLHFDPLFIAMPSIFGFYILTFTCFFLWKWLKAKDDVLLPMLIGNFFAALFIILTWIPSDIQLVFMGPQRYLTIPSIGTTLFTAGLLVIVYERIKNIQAIKNFAWSIFLLLIPLIVVSYNVANKFFDYELTYAGAKGSDQIRMKNKFRQLIGNVNKEESSLFYFDESADRENGYFNEGTVIAGFEYWMRVNMDGSLNNFPEPGMIRTNIQCPEHTHQNCIDILKIGLVEVDGQQGIWYKDPIRGNINRFYKLSNLHAVRFINKDIIDITESVLKELDNSH